MKAFVCYLNHDKILKTQYSLDKLYMYHVISTLPYITMWRAGVYVGEAFVTTKTKCIP